GADVICPACGTTNSTNSVHCGACGSPLEGAASASSIKSGDWMDINEASAFAQSRDVGREQREQQLEAAGVKSGDEAKGGAGRTFAIIGVVLLVVCGVGFFLFSQTSAQEVYVSGHEWERTISVEEYQSVSEGDWQESVPSLAYNETCYQRERGTERVPDGETCRTERRDNGDGTFSEREVCETAYREETVFDTWCDYRIDQWESVDPVLTSGTLADAPTWGAAPQACSSTRLGCERESGRDERYTVLFQGDDNEFRCSFTEQDWRDIQIESNWTVEVRMVGGAVCDTLEQR
ncbi:MAG: hypothetical protein AAF125_24070, partial [Chloroflexota bacterium]